MKEQQRARSWIFFILYSALIIISSHQPISPHFVPPFLHYDKIAHFIEYLFLAILLQRALFYSNISRKTLITVTFCVLFAISDEVHQHFVPNRTMSFLDFLADCAGIGVGIGLFQIVYKKKEKINYEV